MDIKTVLLLVNSIGLFIATVLLCVLIFLLRRSERKLAKYGESWFFKTKNARKGGKQ